MNVFFDTNVLLDIALARQPFAEASIAAWSWAAESGEKPAFAPHSLATFYYMVRQAHGNMRATEAVRDLMETGQIAEFDDVCAREAAELGFADFEDAMVAACAARAGAERILTRNKTDFKRSPVQCQSPEEFLDEVRGSP